VEQIIKLLQNHNHFVIAGHIGPDGDTIGSCYGLAMALDKIGKNAKVVLEDYAAKYDIIPGREYLYKGTEALGKEVFIALDCADPERLGAARAFFDKACVTVCIDHHETNSGFADLNYIDPAASSTAEMVFGIIDAITDIDTDIAAAIYAGIVGDTGGFRYVSTSRSTMHIAARLMDIIPFTNIYGELMHGHSFEAAKAFGLALGACKTALGGKVVYTCVTKEMLKSVGADSSDMDSVVEYLMSTRGAEVALFLYERHVKGQDDNSNENENTSSHKKIRVSMRSRGMHVGRIAASLGGGGHKMAAGCTVIGTMDEVLAQVLAKIEL